MPGKAQSSDSVVSMPSPAAITLPGTPKRTAERGGGKKSDQKSGQKSFGNARAIRTLWERTREAQAVRLATAGIDHAGRDAVVTIEVGDIEAAFAGSEISGSVR